MSQPTSDLTLPKRGMPVTVITGFLGSGKTTLLNHILSNNQELKIAVLVNEFGDIGIDSQLLVAIDEDMVQLSNGCICCTINDSLVDAVYNVLEKSDRIDYMIIETTGIADPLPIMLTFLGTGLRDLTRLDSVLCLVDAAEFTPNHFESEAALKQLIYSDIILLNKIDLVSAGQLNQLEMQIQAIKEGARILHCQKGQVPLPLLLDINLDHSQIEQPTPRSSTPIAPLYHTHHSHHTHHDHADSHDHAEHFHSHHLDNDGFMSVSYRSDRPFSLQAFENFLDTLPPEVFRAKGILWFQESPHKHIFQLSGKRCTLEVEPWETLAPSNQLVFIGRHLNATAIQQQLAQCGQVASVV